MPAAAPSASPFAPNSGGLPSTFLAGFVRGSEANLCRRQLSSLSDMKCLLHFEKMTLDFLVQNK